jgi:hypothetical protein
MPKTKKTASKSRSKSRGQTKTSAEKEYIVIDEAHGLIFENEEDLFGYFSKYIDVLEDEYQETRADNDFSDEEQIELKSYLDETLDEPDEVWMDEQTFKDLTIFHFIRSFENSGALFRYIAVAYVSSEEEYPTFVFIHFPTRDPQMLEDHRVGELVYDKGFERALKGAIDGDALGEGDPLAMGLYNAMLTVRSEKDIGEDQFKDYADLREDTIENADEIWKKNDLEGHVLVSFVKEFPDHETQKDLAYIAVTQEDEQSNVHSLLFSFPTTDKTLVDRYRQGENLQAEEISQENSH